MTVTTFLRLRRREALQRLACAAALPVLGLPAAAQTGAPVASGPTGTRTDLDLVHPSAPWRRVLSPGELRTAAALADTILPADEQSPAASAVGVPEFIDEWVSAPFPDQKADQVQIRGGLTWLNTEANRRFGRDFAGLSEEQRRRICDDICSLPQAQPRFQAAARFFAKFRDLTATGFYTTAAGIKDLRYVGNVPLASFEGPPREVLERLKLI